MSLADDKLDQLCRELCEHRDSLGGACATQFAHQKPIVDTHAPRLPLVHGLNDSAGLPDLRSILDQRELLSAAVRNPKEPRKEIEHWLGLPDCVYTSVGVLYPHKNVALLFRAEIEGQFEAESSPWDSGAFGRGYRFKQLSDEERDQHRQQFRRYCLPAPQYRKYFSVYIATCFGNLDEYLYGRPYSFPDPLGLMNKQSFGSRIFEVRVPHRLICSSRTLLAIFVRDKAGDEHWVSIKRRLSALASNGVYVDYYPHNSRLDSRVQAFVSSTVRSDP